MRRLGVVVGAGNPIPNGWNRFKSLHRPRCRRSEEICGLAEGGTVQPDDMSVVFSELRMVVIVRRNIVGLEVPVSRGTGMGGIRFVNVLRRQRRRKGDVGRQK